jgi:acetylornithine deacetylase
MLQVREDFNLVGRCLREAQREGTMPDELPDVGTLTERWATIPSVTGDETALLRVVEADLIAQQWPVLRIAVERGRYNLLAGEKRGKVIFSTHLDTVPPFFSPRWEGDRLLGRGVSDAKGAAAAMFIAATWLRERVRDVSILYVVGEEGSSDGAKAAQAAGLGFDYVINGEPTDNTFASWQKGTLRVTLTTRGTPCHSGYPEQGESAIHRLVGILGTLLVAEWQSSVELGQETVNIGSISGGLADNVLAPEASARLMFRTVRPYQVTLERLKAITKDAAFIDVEGGCDPLPIYSPPGYQSKPVAFGSDLTYLRQIGTPVMIGPGSILVAHTAREAIARADLARAVELYKEAGSFFHGGVE